MSSESDGGESHRAWTLVDNHGHAEDSEDSSGSSSDFVDLGEDCVQYHVNRSSSVIDISPGNSASPSASSSSLPANFRAHTEVSAIMEEHFLNPVSPDDDHNIASADLPSYPAALDQADMFHGDGAVKPRNYSNASAGIEMIAQKRIKDEQRQAEKCKLHVPTGITANIQSPDLENSASSAGSTLTGSQSLLFHSSSSDLENPEIQQERGGIQTEGPANFQLPSTLNEFDDEETGALEDHPTGTASDSISMDSIEVLSMPSDAGNFLEGDDEMTRRCGGAMGGGMERVQDDSKLQAVPALVSMAAVVTELEEIPHHCKVTHMISPSEESDTSEFERIEPEMIPTVDEIGNQPNDNGEENKMDLAGTRLTEDLEEDSISNVSFSRLFDQPQNVVEALSHDQDDLHSPFLQPLDPSAPSLSPNVSRSPTPNIHPQRAQLASSIQPFPFDRLTAEGVGHRRRFASGLGLQPQNRIVMPRQHSNSSSDDSFELLQRPRRQDDDAASTVSSSSSDLSGFVNVRQRRGPPLSRSVSSRHSDFDDMLDSVSNFTDISEDCLPANMMIQSQKSGVRQYKHRRDEGLNTRLDWLVAMVLLAGLALGIGHFIGSTQEMAHQHSINTGQVQRLRELQDDLVTCLDRSLGIDSRITTEKSSPALQAVKLLEGLNSKMLEEDVDASRLLEQKVGPDDRDTIRLTDSDVVWRSTKKEEKTNGDEVQSDSKTTSVREEAGKDGIVKPQSHILADSSDSFMGDSKDSVEGYESMQSHKIKQADDLGLSEKDSVDELLSDNILSSADERGQTKTVVFDGSEDEGLELVYVEEIKEQGEAVERTQNDTSPDVYLGDALKDKQLQVGVDDAYVDQSGDFEEKHPNRDDMEMDSDNMLEDHSTDMKNDLDSVDQIQDSTKSVDDGLPPEDSIVEVLQRKIELMEAKMNEVIKTAQQWQDMLEESKRADETSEEDQSKTQYTDHSSKSSNNDEGDNNINVDENEKDSLAGVAALLESLWPGLLSTDQGKKFLHHLNETDHSSFFSNVNNQNKSASWSDVFYREIAALMALPDSEEVQAIVNNTKLFAAHLEKEIESMTGYLKSQSAKLAEENNITVEGLSEQANKAWTKLKNATADVLDYNKMVLSTVGEQLADTLHSVENISAEIISKQNLSFSSMGNMAEQVWGTVKNYSAIVKDKILNKTSESATNTQSGFGDKTSDTETNENTESGFGERLKGAWDTVRNYSSNFTSKQNLSISGLREQVKAAWGKVKNTSAQVLEDISESNLAEKLTEGAQKLGEKIGTTLESVKEKVKGFHKSKGHNGKKKHQKHSERHPQNQRRTEEKQDKKKHKHQRNREQEERNNFHSGKDNKKENSHKLHHSHHKNHVHHNPQTSNNHPRRDGGIKIGKDEEPQEHDHYSVPSRHQHQWYRHGNDDAVEIHTPDESSDAPHSNEDQGYLYSAPPRPQLVLPTHGNAGTIKEEGLNLDASHRKQDRPHKQNSIPSRQQMKKPIQSSDAIHQDQSDGGRQDVPKDKKMIPSEHFKEPNKRCPPHQARFGSKVHGENNAESNWEDLFDCVDMHCKGDEECMHSQRRDAAKLYAELLDYQEWLKERNLKKDVRELKEFLEELGEFLSETDSDDKDLDELKNEFGEMVQDMEEGALKRLRKQDKARSDTLRNGVTDVDQDVQKQENPAVVNNVEAEVNSTIIIDLKTLPQQQDPKSDQAQFSSQSHRSAGNTERRKYAGHGFHSFDDDDHDWYFQRAKVRAEQRESHHRSGDENHRDTPNWYLHWVQGRINGRTGVTVWDMYEWIKERYVLRKELRTHEMEDHTNWFLRRP